MPMRILIAPDKFKGTLTAHAAAEAMARGWRAARPADSLTLLPMSDGGDGFGEIISAALGAETQTVKTVDAAHRPLEATWWWHSATRTAIIEAARVNGLAQLPPGKFHPFELDTFGLGAVFRRRAKSARDARSSAVAAARRTTAASVSPARWAGSSSTPMTKTSRAGRACMISASFVRPRRRAGSMNYPSPSMCRILCSAPPAVRASTARKKA